MLHPAASRHPKATHQWLLMGVQACRLPALKPLKRLKGLKRLKTLKMLKTLNGRPSLPFASPETSPETPSLKHSPGMLHPAASRHPKATHQWLLMGVQACRLPALKPLKRLKGLKTLKMLKTLARRLPALKPAMKCHRLNIPLACFILQPVGTPRPDINGFLWAFKPAVCQPLNP